MGTSVSQEHFSSIFRAHDEIACPCDTPVPLTKRHSVTTLSQPATGLHQFPVTNYQFPGTHNSSELNLFWESDSPVTVNRDLHLTEYRLVNLWSNFTVANYSLTAEVSTSFGLHSRVYGKFGE